MQDPEIFRHSQFFSSVLVTVALATSPAVFAQPTGNPKGTAAPVSREADKPTAATRPSGSVDGSSSVGKLDSDSGPTSARTNSGISSTPGSGTAGGLPKTQPGDGRPADLTKGQTRQPGAPAR